jgi:membrane protease YdiL (CAAX protease family)
MTNEKTKRNLSIFIIVTFTCGWLGVLLDMALPEQPGEETLGQLFWLVAPILTGFLLRALNRDWKDAGLTPRLKKGWKWYLVALLAFPIVSLITVVLALMFESVEVTGLSIAVLPLIVTSFCFSMIKNFFEEFAWRGYLTPKLLALKPNDWVLYIVSGSIWALWHVPYFLIFLPDSVYEHIILTRAMMIPVGVFVMVCWTVVYVELYRLTKSVWPCVVFHAVEDAVPTLLVVQGYLTFTQTGAFLFDPALGGIVAALLFLGIGLVLRAIRIKKESPIAKSTYNKKKGVVA